MAARNPSICGSLRLGVSPNWNSLRGAWLSIPAPRRQWALSSIPTIAEPAASRRPKADETVIRQPFKDRTSEELMSLLSAVTSAILGTMLVTTLYFGREILVPIALAILLSFVLAPLVGLLQRVRVPRGLAVVSVVIVAFALIFAMGSLLATQLTHSLATFRATNPR